MTMGNRLGSKRGKYERRAPIRSVRERFDDSVSPEPMSGCWLWTGSARGKGEWQRYGQLRVGNSRDGTGRMVKAHRLSYELHIGPIPAELSVCHRCDVPECVNPAHLFLGTSTENIADRHTKGRSGAARGEAHGQSKLNAEIIQEIRARYAAGGVTYPQLAAEFGVTGGLIGHIVRRFSWRHVK